jgi:hypothetical protein
MVPFAQAAAQARPAGAGRPWVEFTVGAGREAQNCPFCSRNDNMGGAVGAIAAGLTITPQFGVAVLGRAFSELTFEEHNNGHGSTYLMALGQFSPPTTSWLTLNLGGGYGHHSGGNSGAGAAVAVGFALRATGASPLGLTLDASVIQSVTGRAMGSNGQLTAYRPTLATVGLGLSLAGRPAVKRIPR